MSTHSEPDVPLASSVAANPQAPRLDYAAITRGPGRRWWRMPLALLLFLGLWLTFTVLLSVAFTVAAIPLERPWDWWLDELSSDFLGPTGFLFNNLFLASLVPTTILSTSLAQRIGMGFTHSVAGRWRWRWFAQILGILLPLWLLYVGAGVLLDLPAVMTPHPQVAAMLVIIWLTTPLQCAGEEYAFRGWLAQNVGGLFANRVLAWAVPTVLSALLFALAHGSLDPWILMDLAIFAVAAAVMTWRTGGLEAAVALHTLNNMLVMNYTLTVGGFNDSIIGAETKGSAISVVVTLIAQALAVALVWWWAKRRGVQQYTSGPTRAHLTVKPPRPMHPVINR